MDKTEKTDKETLFKEEIKKRNDNKELESLPSSLKVRRIDIDNLDKWRK